MLCPAYRRTQLSTVIPPAFRVREGCCKTAHKIVAGIQGARHAQFGISSDLHNNKLQSSLFPIGFQQRDHDAPPPRVPCGKFMDSAEKNGISCLLTIGNSNQNLKEENEIKTPHIVLFGQLILTEQQISKSSSGDTTGNSLSDGSLK
ncbi:Auxin response factor 18 [Morella rubra]|uniref:Auxin response factor 18 n=1 Tax=Morella rubra TaxID=262757 RepID=A0A6A1W1D8_9ROSI|nr:Auxin response factor 18 [Morella rubra]